ncbi:613_t:CDS:2 [Diversispora eburnea]|uniref:613_t:CDS:1 n=1 Tax=Diversispora eburnea TaxID=1213867 RepID=A0A9N8ZWZ9_9GLOM|nr:613_t:CDS:2 [Diversispora eburnea]
MKFKIYKVRTNRDTAAHLVYFDQHIRIHDLPLGEIFDVVNIAQNYNPQSGFLWVCYLNATNGGYGIVTAQFNGSNLSSLSLPHCQYSSGALIDTITINVYNKNNFDILDMGGSIFWDVEDLFDTYRKCNEPDNTISGRGFNNNGTLHGD